MATSAHITTPAQTERWNLPQVRRGGPRRPPAPTPQPLPPETVQAVQFGGSHMPLDITIHWHWRNPLNAFPFGIALLLVLALLAML